MSLLLLRSESRHHNSIPILDVKDIISESTDDSECEEILTEMWGRQLTNMNMGYGIDHITWYILNFLSCTILVWN